MNKRKKAAESIQKWMPFFMIGCILLGSILGSTLYYYFQSEFPYEIIVGCLISSIVLIFIEWLKRKRKKDKLPEIDERITKNLSRFTAFASHITLMIIFVLLAIFTMLGTESISVSYLWILYFAYIWIVGIAVIVIKKR